MKLVKAIIARLTGQRKGNSWGGQKPHPRRHYRPVWISGLDQVLDYNNAAGYLAVTW